MHANNNIESDHCAQFLSNMPFADWRGSLTFFNGFYETTPLREMTDASWNKVSDALAPSTPNITKDKERGLYFIPCSLRSAPFVGKTLEKAIRAGESVVGKQRSANHVTDASMLVIDCDGLDHDGFQKTLSNIIKNGITVLAYTSHSYGRVDKPGVRARLAIPLDRPISVDEYRSAWHGFDATYLGNMASKADSSGANLYQQQGAWCCHPDRKDQAIRTNKLGGVASADALISVGSKATISSFSIASNDNKNDRESPPSDAEKVADQCQQIRSFRDTGGNLPEPLWYDCLGVVAFCDGGKKLGLEWSSGYAGYSIAETEKKIAQRMASAGPTTCDQFKKTNPRGCDGCTQQRKSPIQIGQGPQQVTVAHLGSIWNNPQPVKASLPPVPPFDYDLLPPAFRSLIQDVAERMQCPPDYLAVGILVAAGAIIGNKIGIQPKQLDAGWVEVPNLWGAVIGRPGVMKTPALSQVLAPLKVLEQQALIAHTSALAQYQLDKMLHEASMVKIKEQVKKGATVQSGQMPIVPDEPQAKRYILNDATYQKIGEVLKGNLNGLLIFQDELTGLLERLDSVGQESARAFYLQAWEGKQSYTFDRIERGTVGIPKLCLSLLGGIQPGKFKEYLRSAVNGGKGDDGLMQRFQLMVYPDIDPEWKHIDRIPDIKAVDDVQNIFWRLSGLEPLAIGAIETPSGIPALRFDQAAQVVFNLWWSRLEHSLRKGQRHPALESHFSKYRKLIPTLALLDHLIEGKSGPVQLPSLERALIWSTYLKSHTERVYAVVTAGCMDSAKALFDRITRGSLKDGFTARDIYRKNWSMLTTPKEATEAAEMLVDHGWLRAQTDKLPGTDGRPTARYFINPQLKIEA